MGIDCKTKGHLSLPDKTGWKPYVCKQQVTVQIPVFKEKVSMWVQAGTENQCSVWDCYFMAQAGQQLQELKDLTIWKLVVQIRMDGHLWDVLTHLHQTGNGCWFSSCGEKKNFIYQPYFCTASATQECYCAVCILYTDHQQQQWLSGLGDFLHKKYAETMLSFNAAHDNTRTCLRPCTI